MLLDSYKKLFAQFLAPVVNLSEQDTLAMIATPPQTDMGDLAFPCFTLAKEAKKAPQVLASQVVSQLEASLPAQFSKIHAVGPYINVFIDATDYISQVLSGQSNESPSFATGRQDKKILLEYMSGNPNKPLHVGHARNVCIGDTLRRVYEDLGYHIDTSHYGDDSGVNVGYNIVGHKYYDMPLDAPEGVKFDHYCGEVYLKMRGMDEDPEFKDRLSKTLHAIEHDSDPEITKLHKEYVKKCTIEQLKTCRRVGASFNMINRETDILHLNLFAEALEILKHRGHVVFVDDAFLADPEHEKFADAKGCWIIDLSSVPAYAKEEKQYAIIVKSDGVATYVAKDIAFAMRKLGYLNKNFHFYNFVEQPDVGQGPHPIYSTTSDETIDEKITFGDYTQAITIIDNRQIPAQTVVKSSLELLGFVGADKHKEYTPLGYGVVYLTPNTLLKGGFELSDEEKAMTRLPFASRKGWTVTMDEMLDLLYTRAYEETKKRNETLTDDQLRDTAERIAISSFRFFLTKSDIYKDITFDIDEVLDMEGETGAYALYTNARIQAVIEKSKISDELQTINYEGNIDFSLLTHPTEIQLVKKIDELSQIQEDVISQLAPHLLNRYIISVCQLFNTYYNEVHIGNSEDDVKHARLFLLRKLHQTLEKAMVMSGMRPVKRM